MDNLDNAFAALMGDCAKQGLLKTVVDKDKKERVVFVKPEAIYKPTNLVLLCYNITCRSCGESRLHSNAHILRESINAAGDRVLTTQINTADTHLPRRIDTIEKMEAMCLPCFESEGYEVQTVCTDVDVISKQRKTEMMTDSNPKGNDDIFASFQDDAMEQ